VERVQNAAQDSQNKVQKQLQSALETEKNLQSELDNLHKEINFNLKPLIEILGLALWQGEAAHRKAHEAAAEDMAKFKLEAGAREAGIRIHGAGREIDYLERLSQKDNEIEKMRSEREAWEAERSQQESLEGQPDPDSQNGWVVNQLSLALAASDLRQEKLRRGLRDFKIRLSTQKQQAVTIKTELEALVKNQAEALQNHKAWLSELVPLVGFFLEQGLDFWTQGPGQGDARQAVLYFLREENVSLGQELERFRHEHQTLWAERQTLLEVQAGLKERLLELKPLVGFLILQFVDNAVALAQAWNQRDVLLSEMASLHATGKFGPYDPALGPNSLDIRQEMRSTQERIKDLESENALLKSEIDRAADELDKQRAKALDLNRTKEETAVLLSGQNQRLAEMNEQYQAQSEVLKKVQTEASRLDAENQRLGDTADRQAAELAQQTAEITALKASPRQDGQLEAAWGALNYLGTRAADSLATLQARLDQEARQLEEAFRQIRKRDDEILVLEKRQDTLALLYWTIVQMSVEGQLSLPKPAVPALPAPEADEDDEPEEVVTKPAKKAGEKGFLGSGIIAEIRKAARKSLFSLILAGGLVLHLQASSQAQTLLLGGTDTPIIAGTPESVRDFGSGPLVKPQFGQRPFGHFSGEVTFPGVSVGINNDPNPISSRMFCRSLNRTIDLGFLSSKDRLKGATEAKALEFLAEQGKRWGLQEAVMLRLVRGAYDKDKTVFLADLGRDDTPFTLMQPYLPQMTRVLRRVDFKDVLGFYILPCLDGMEKLTAEFWDRLFVDFYHRTMDLEEAAMGLAWHLERRRSFKANVEFGGLLGPILDMENISSEEIFPVLVEYISSHWPGMGFRKKKSVTDINLSKRLAGDILSNGKIFGLPWTFLFPLVHQARTNGSMCPTTLEIYGSSQKILRQVKSTSRQWSSSKPPLCDLDLLVRLWPGFGVQDLYKKKMDLFNFFSQVTQESNRLFV
jgi:hypothetical protein